MMEAYVMIETETEASESVLSSLRQMDGITRANIVAGEFDIIALTAADSRQALLRRITGEMQSIDGVVSTRTNVILE